MKLEGVPVEEGISDSSEYKEEEYSGDNEDYIDKDDYSVLKNWRQAQLSQATELDYAVTVSVHSYYGYNDDLPKQRELYGSQADQMDPGKQVLINCPLAGGCIYVPEECDEDTLLHKKPVEMQKLAQMLWSSMPTQATCVAKCPVAG